MTDLDTIKEMLSSADIIYETHVIEPVTSEEEGDKEGITQLAVERGYAGFYSILSFASATGKLRNVEAYE